MILCSPYYHNITNNTTTTAHHHHYQHHYHWLLPTLSLGGWPHRARWRTLAAAAWGGTTLTWREKQTLSFSRGDGRRRFFSLYWRFERMSSLKEIREILVYFYMMVSYQMRNSFSCTMKSSWALCYSKENVRRFIEPICDLRIATFSHAPQFLG